MNAEINTFLDRLDPTLQDNPAVFRELVDAYNDQQLLISIGRSLATEHDSEKLLRMILHASKKITGADAGSIYLVEGKGEGSMLRFKYSHTFSLDLDYEEFRMKRDTASIAGYVSLTGEILAIDDVYAIGDDVPYKFNRTFDNTQGYRTKSMLVVPMRNYSDEIIGVIQLINSKEEPSVPDMEEAESIMLVTPEDYEKKVVPFKARYGQLMVAIANQAAISLENTRMINQIRTQFESFVHASVSAIESRDPSTSGHSERVAELAGKLARAVHGETEGAYAGVEFTPNELTELEYAGLLHDFGKIYIDPSVFLKAKKLYPRDFELLQMRLNYLYRSVELEMERARVDGDRANLGDFLKEILKTKELVTTLNEPAATKVDPEPELARIASIVIPSCARGIAGETIPIVTHEETVNLRIRRGSLNDEERKVIQSHVDFSYQFLSQIPWPPEYENIPDYAYKHHEMLDGSGYPRGLKAPELPLQARMLAIADIYDALAAKDRPYKTALPPEKIRAIMEGEGRDGKLDAELVRIFLDKVAFLPKPAP